MQNVSSNMLLRYNRIPEFVASRYTRFPVQKSIENARKRVLDAVSDVLLSKAISNKFTTVQAVVFIILLYYYSISKFVDSR